MFASASRGRDRDKRGVLEEKKGQVNGLFGSGTQGFDVV